MISAILLSWALLFEHEAHLNYMVPRSEVPAVEANVMVLVKGVCRCGDTCCEPDAPKFFFALDDAIRFMNENNVSGENLKGVFALQPIALAEQERWRTP